MPQDDSTGFDIDDVFEHSIPTLVDHIPADTVVFDAPEISDWENGYILASNDSTFGVWDIQRATRMDNPDEFTRERGVWISYDRIADWFIEQRGVEEPGEAVNKPLTMLGDN